MDYLKLFNRSRNLLPVLSIEGGEDNTDDRRGRGMYRQLQNTMELLHKDGILFGASVTVTKENLREVTGREFLDNLCCHHGCKAIFYIEFVPVNSKARGMAPEEEEREYMNQKLLELREIYGDMLFISFPGDEKSSGGCLAAEEASSTSMRSEVRSLVRFFPVFGYQCKGVLHPGSAAVQAVHRAAGAGGSDGGSCGRMRPF